jgi:hypothetical protein
LPDVLSEIFLREGLDKGFRKSASDLPVGHKIFLGTNYFDDLQAQGYSKADDLLKDIHARRNDFAHGKPQAINDAIVAALTERFIEVNAAAARRKWSAPASAARKNTSPAGVRRTPPLWRSKIDPPSRCSRSCIRRLTVDW